MLKTARACICDYVLNNPNFFDDIKFEPRETYGSKQPEYCFNYLIVVDKFDLDLQKYTDDIDIYSIKRSYRCDDYKLYVCNLFKIVYGIVVIKNKKQTNNEFFKHILSDYFQKLYRPYFTEYCCVYFDMLKTLFDNAKNTNKSIKKNEVKYKQCLKKYTKIENKKSYFFNNREKYIDYEKYLFYKEMDIPQSTYEFIEKRCIDFLNNFSENSLYRIRNKILYLKSNYFLGFDWKKLI